ncbi:MAG TPA: quinone-dependent dihydroorotate dehydrogenase [Candidatus Dormibacteraeota bacterium]|nr:quinone-dependent dihydroorotate dehydrogenase [Candidatus Dormibacteraeota bacterium]
MSGWRSVAYGTVRPLLFWFEPERIHRLTLQGLRVAGSNPIGRALLAAMSGVERRRPQPVELLGLRFRNRVGLGAGFDKDALALRGWAALGLGFVEVGTVTPEPQPGNPRPRLFRLRQDEALINRMGFNNAGAAAVARNVMLARRHLPTGVVVGVNVGRGRTTSDKDAVGDYLAAHRLVAPVADYLAINVSSPNTPGLRRHLQDPQRLVALLEALAGASERIGYRPALLVKLAPDLAPAAFDQLVTALAESPAAGLILANTTLARERMRSPGAGERGGLSGRPLLARTMPLVVRARQLAGERLAIVASGGLTSAEDVATALDAGADLVQLWTGLVYRGPGLIGEAAAVARPVRARSG